MVTHSRIHVWEVLWTEEPGRSQSAGSQRVRHRLATKQEEHPLHRPQPPFPLYLLPVLSPTPRGRRAALQAAAVLWQDTVQSRENGHRVLPAVCPGVFQKQGSTAYTLAVHTCVSKNGPIVGYHPRLFLLQSLSRVRLSATPWTAAHRASLSITISRSLLKPMFIESVMPSNHLMLCRPLLLLPSIFPSIRVFSNESALGIRWPRIGVSASTSILPMNTQD